MVLHVRFESWYISLLSSAKQQREERIRGLPGTDNLPKRSVGCPSLHSSENILLEWTMKARGQALT